jgi:hypothetical protein
MKSRFAQQQSEGSSSYKSSQGDERREEALIEEKVFRFTNTFLKSSDSALIKSETFAKDSMDVDQESNVDESLTNSMVVFSELHSED